MQLLSFISVLACLASAATAMDNLVYGDDPRKPIEVDTTLMCHACHAAVAQTVKHVSEFTLEAHWAAVDSTSCFTFPVLI